MLVRLPGNPAPCQLRTAKFTVHFLPSLYFVARLSGNTVERQEFCIKLGNYTTDLYPDCLLGVPWQRADQKKKSEYRKPPVFICVSALFLSFKLCCPSHLTRRVVWKQIFSKYSLKISTIISGTCLPIIDVSVDQGVTRSGQDLASFHYGCRNSHRAQNAPHRSSTSNLHKQYHNLKKPV